MFALVTSTAVAAVDDDVCEAVTVSSVPFGTALTALIAQQVLEERTLLLLFVVTVSVAMPLIAVIAMPTAVAISRRPGNRGYRGVARRTVAAATTGLRSVVLLRRATKFL